jgi:hypothetical protein
MTRSISAIVGASSCGGGGAALRTMVFFGTGSASTAAQRDPPRWRVHFRGMTLVMVRWPARGAFDGRGLSITKSGGVE